MTARRAEVSAARLALVLAGAASLALQGCTSGGGGPSGPQLLRSVPLDFDVLGVGGHGTIVAIVHHGTRGPFLRIARQDATQRSELVDLGAVPVDIPIRALDDLTVTPEWVALTSGGSTTAVSLTTPAPEVVATATVGGGARAIASGRWLLAAQAGNVLVVRDLGSPGAPQVGAATPAGAAVTGLAEAPDGFYVFTDAGLGHLSTAGGVPAYRQTALAELAHLGKAFLHGTKLHAAGPSPLPGKVRVARIDVSVPRSPVVEASADVEATWGDFTFDGAGAYAVLGEMADYGRYTLTVLRDAGGALSPGASQELPIFRQAASAAHASAGVLFGSATRPYGSTPEILVMYALP